jgi:hypothetical protein
MGKNTLDDADGRTVVGIKVVKFKQQANFDTTVTLT